MKTIGTLKEIGAKVGDMVTFGKGDYVHEITSVNEDGTYLSMVSDGLPGEPCISADDWRIVTRAEKSPIRTVTRKEIVPGVYGKVTVTKSMSAFGCCGIQIYDDMTASELTAAIATLTEIRDAMQNNA